MKIADRLVFLKQSSQTAFDNGLPIIFVEFRQHQRLGKCEALFLEPLAHKPGSVPLPDARTDAHAVKNDAALRPMLTESSCLRLAELGQLVIVRLKERSLRVTDEKKSSHCQSGFPSIVIAQVSRRTKSGHCPHGCESSQKKRGIYAVATWSLLNSAKVFPCSASRLRSGAGCQISPC